MNRARHIIATTVAAGICAGGLTLSAQTPPVKAPEMKSVLAGRKFMPPIRGEATVDFVKSPTRREGATLVTRIQVKNTSPGPIPRLTVDETWYDKNNNLIPGGKGVINGLLQPNEIQTIEIRTPVNPAMSTSMLQFSHANGTVKTHATSSLTAPTKEPATKAAAAKKK